MLKLPDPRQPLELALEPRLYSCYSYYSSSPSSSPAAADGSTIAATGTKKQETSLNPKPISLSKLVVSGPVLDDSGGPIALNRDRVDSFCGVSLYSRQIQNSSSMSSKAK